MVEGFRRTFKNLPADGSSQLIHMGPRYLCSFVNRGPFSIIASTPSLAGVAHAFTSRTHTTFVDGRLGIRAIITAKFVSRSSGAADHRRLAGGPAFESLRVTRTEDGSRPRSRTFKRRRT